MSSVGSQNSASLKGLVCHQCKGALPWGWISQYCEVCRPLRSENFAEKRTLAAKVDTKRPCLRWHGGKWILAPWIISHFPRHRVYVEPFGGAASVLMRKERSYAEVYNDLDDDVVNLFRVLRDPVQSRVLREALELTPYARTEFEDAYEPPRDDVDRARKMVARSFMGFGSCASGNHYSTGFRADSNRSGSVPAHDWRNYPGNVGLMVERWRGVVIENRSWERVLEAHDGAETLFYVDPPYPRSTRNTSGRCYAHEMTDGEHEALGAALNRLVGMVVVSSYPSGLYDRLFAGWRLEKRAAHADGASDRVECLWMNEACVRNQAASRDMFEGVSGE